MNTYVRLCINLHIIRETASFGDYHIVSARRIINQHELSKKKIFNILTCVQKRPVNKDHVYVFLCVVFVFYLVVLLNQASGANALCTECEFDSNHKGSIFKTVFQSLWFLKDIVNIRVTLSSVPHSLAWFQSSPSVWMCKSLFYNNLFHYQPETLPYISI